MIKSSKQITEVVTFTFEEEDIVAAVIDRLNDHPGYYEQELRITHPDQVRLVGTAEKGIQAVVTLTSRG